MPLSQILSIEFDMQNRRRGAGCRPIWGCIQLLAGDRNFYVTAQHKHDFRSRLHRQDDIPHRSLRDNGQVYILPCLCRCGPILNDALIEDAEMVGLRGIVRVIDNGSDAPGTILEDCSEGFCGRFEESALVIAKGQGSYETLSEVDKDMFFMLQPKCKVLAEHLGREIGSPVLIRTSGQ